MAIDIEPVYRQKRAGDGRNESVGDPIGFVRTERERRRSTIHGFVGPVPSEQDPHKTELPGPEDTTHTLAYTKVIRRWTPDGLIALFKQPWAQVRAYNAVIKAEHRQQR